MTAAGCVFIVFRPEMFETRLIPKEAPFEQLLFEKLLQEEVVSLKIVFHSRLLLSHTGSALDSCCRCISSGQQCACARKHSRRNMIYLYARIAALASPAGSNLESRASLFDSITCFGKPFLEDVALKTARMEVQAGQVGLASRAKGAKQANLASR